VADIRRNPFANRPAAGATCADMRRRRDRIRQAMRAKVRLDAPEAARFSGSVRPTDCLTASCAVSCYWPLFKSFKRAIVARTWR
jgi:hypothetical protein